MTIDFLAHVRTESARFGEVLAATDPTVRVPSCPDWTAADLLWHLTEVQLFWAAIVRERLSSPASITRVARPDDHAALLSLYRDAGAALVDVLSGADDDEPVWTWFDPEQNVGFVRRRQAHEALVHRLDAELAADALTGVDPVLATDGADEVLVRMYNDVPPWRTAETPGAIGRVAATDTGAEWFVQLGRWSGTEPATGTAYTDEPSLTVVDAGQASFHVSGAARDLDAWLWNRPVLTQIARAGDYTAFEALIRTGLQ